MTDKSAKALTKAINRLAKVQEDSLKHSKEVMKKAVIGAKKLEEMIKKDL